MAGGSKDLIADILEPFSGSIGKDAGPDPVDFIRTISGAVALHANDGSTSLTPEQHEAVDRMQKYAGELVSRANEGPVSRDNR